MSLLDLIHGKQTRSIAFLELQDNLADDLVALRQALIDWPDKDQIDVGESGTLLRFLKFTAWQKGRTKKFKLHGTLANREVSDDRSMISWPLAKLLTLDGGSSQWASAAVLNGNSERVVNAPYKLKLTYRAVSQWRADTMWQPRLDATIQAQAEAFTKAMKGEASGFAPEQAEDYCFARAFGLITPEEGERRWPALRNHESDRIAEMETQLNNYKAGKAITSHDHRVVQAIAMYACREGRGVSFEHPKSVSKSWPRFWEFLATQA